MELDLFWSIMFMLVAGSAALYFTLRLRRELKRYGRKTEAGGWQEWPKE